MTYCAALRVNDAVHLIADSAVTSDDIDNAPKEAETPFGEPYAPENGRLTEDGAVKIFDIEGDAFAFAGKVSLGILFLRHYLRYRQENFSKKSSFELSVIELAGYPNVTALGVLREEGDLLILKGTPKKEPEIDSIEEFASIGADGKLRKLFDVRLLDVNNKWGGEVKPEECLTLLTATGMGTSIKHGTFRQGVGGAFNGITVSSGKSVWQKDHIIVVFRGGESDHRAASIYNRDNWFITRYKIGGQPVGGKSVLTPFGSDCESIKYEEELFREREVVIRSSLYPIKTGKFCFASVIDQDTGHVHVIDMQRKQRHEFLEITPPVNYTGTIHYAVSCAPTLRQHMLDVRYADNTCFQTYSPSSKKRKMKPSQ